MHAQFELTKKLEEYTDNFPPELILSTMVKSLKVSTQLREEGAPAMKTVEAMVRVPFHPKPAVRKEERERETENEKANVMALRGSRGSNMSAAPASHPQHTLSKTFNIFDAACATNFRSWG
jgi:hypothetical protein